MLKSLFYSALLLALAGCAIMSSPEGGPKDAVPPQILNTTPPNKSVNFTSTTIEIDFDEYIELSDFNNQFYASPPLKKRITQKLKGKTLILTLNETLLPNTTYTFNFGNSISDITEKNSQTDFKYVFSTGPYLDSLAIGGNVVDAYTGLPEAGVLALLYQANLADSTLLKTKPSYYAVTDKEGNFNIENLALDTFQLFAVKDLNFDLVYNHGAEKYGFLAAPIISGSPTKPVIRIFNERGGLKLMDTKQKEYGVLLLGFTKKPDSVSVFITGSEILPTVATENYIESDQNGDTLFYWYNPKQYPADANFLFLNVEADTLVADSVRVLLKKLPQPTLVFSFKTPGKIAPKGPLVLESNIPITNFSTDSFSLLRGEEKIPFQLNQLDKRHFSLNFERTYGQTQSLILKKGALTDFFGATNDSLLLNTTVANEEELAILIIKITAADSKNKILQLVDLKTKKTVEERPFTNKLEFTLRDANPASYGIRVIWDDNNNGLWDAGAFFGRVQAENVMYYPKPIELRANWELETVWEIPAE